MPKRFLVALGSLILISASCGGGTPEPDSGSAAGVGGTSIFGEDAVALWVNRDLGVGPDRLLIGVFNIDGTRLGSPDQPVTLEAAPADDPSNLQSRAAGFTWSVPDAIGYYRADFVFDRPGIWEVTVRASEGDPLETILIEVRDNACRAKDAAELGISACAPRVGELAPRLATPTLDDQPLQALTSDPEPDPRLYGLSLDEALDNGRPTVIVFATPAYCQFATCGPIVQNVRTVLDDYPGVDFVHIEVYTGLADPDFAPDPDHLSPAVAVYTLPTEPWVFVTDASGVITARFEGALDPAELLPYL